MPSWASTRGASTCALALEAKRSPICFPEPTPWEPFRLRARGLRDASLALRTDSGVVGNDVDADDRSLIVVTGANSGGKSTFLRSVGLAQVMMQCGLFVNAEMYRASTCEGLFTHFIREEDRSMKSGRLDDELSRMSELADLIGGRSMMLFNESFSTTNEREGSEIARQIVRALLESGVRICFVTHQFDLAEGFMDDQFSGSVLFLRAERERNGVRSYANWWRANRVRPAMAPICTRRSSPHRSRGVAVCSRTPRLQRCVSPKCRGPTR